MTQAIQTKHIEPTTHKGARIKAYWDGCSVVIPYDSSLGTRGNHDKAVKAFVKKYDLADYGYNVENLSVGSIKLGYVYVTN